MEGLERDVDRQVREIWADTFNALGLGGLADEDAAHQSLSKIQYGSRGTGGSHNTFKGKRAAYKRLENRQIFNRLMNLQIPEAAKAVEDAKKWLGTNETGKNHANADTTVSSLLEKLFSFPMGDTGNSAFHGLIDSDAPQVDAKLQKAPAMPPKQDMGVPDQTQGPEQPPPAVPPDPAQQQQAQPPMAPPQRPPQPMGQPVPGM